MYRKNIVFLMLIVLSISANTETMQQPLCKDFLNLELKKEMIVPIEKNKSVLIDINNDGEDEDVTLNIGLAHDTQRLYESLSYPQEHKTTTDLDLRYFLGQQILLYHNHYYLVYYETIKKLEPKYITSIDTIKGKSIENSICKFKNRKKLILDKNNDAILCANLLGKYKKEEIINFNIPSKFKFKPNITRKDYGVNPKKITIGNIAYFDFNNDSKKEYIQLLEGRYGGEKHYIHIDKENMKLIDINNQNLSDVKGTWLQYADKVYFVNGFTNLADKPISIGIIEHNRNKKICSYRIQNDIFLDMNKTK